MTRESKKQAFLNKKLHPIKEKNMKDNQVEQMFTVLTPQEASVIEGGAYVRVNRIKAITASSDGSDDPTDEVKIHVGGTNIWGSYSMVSGMTRNVGRGRRFDNPTLIEIFDDDTWPNPDDSAGSISINPSMRGTFTRPASGDKSQYEVNFTISA